jgi:hypothetical protein
VAPLDVISGPTRSKRSLEDSTASATAADHRCNGKKIKLDSSVFDTKKFALQSKLAPESVDTASNGECSSSSTSSDEEPEEEAIGRDIDMQGLASSNEAISSSSASSSSSEASSDSSSDSSESGAASDEEDVETLVNAKKMPETSKETVTKAELPINPPMSLIGKNKKKLLPKMLNHERVHQRFEPEPTQAPEVSEQIQENRLEYLAPAEDQV